MMNNNAVNSHRGKANMNNNDGNGNANDNGRQTGRNPLSGLGARISQNIEAARKGYEQLVHAIIRPPRAKYNSDTALGPQEFKFCDELFRRKDIELPTHRNLTMKVSIWTRVDDASEGQNGNDGQGEEGGKSSKSKKTMVVYLHGNASCRLEVLPQLSFLLASGIYGVVSLDFTGSGQSDGNYVSLGYYERFDLQHLLEYLQQEYGGGYLNEDESNLLQVVLWGRSMGASTALMHASQLTQNQHAAKVAEVAAREAAEAATAEMAFANGDGEAPIQINISRTTSDGSGSNGSDPAGASGTGSDSRASSPTTTAFDTTKMIKGLICDSPFCSLKQLCGELVEKARQQGIVVPGIVVTAAIALIDRSVQNLAKFSVHDITPIDHVQTCNVPALFIVGADDDFIPCHHSEDLVEYYQKGIRTNLFMVPGGHNDPRPELVFEAVKQFLCNSFANDALTSDMALPIEAHNIQNTYYKNPPWAYRRYPKIYQQIRQKIIEEAIPAATGTAVSAKTTATAATNAAAAEKAPSRSTSLLDADDDEGTEEHVVEEQQEEEELGMTKERQDDIQNKVNQMFGQQATTTSS